MLENVLYHVSGRRETQIENKLAELSRPKSAETNEGEPKEHHRQAGRGYLGQSAARRTDPGWEFIQAITANIKDFRFFDSHSCLYQDTLTMFPLNLMLCFTAPFDDREKARPSRPESDC